MRALHKRLSSARGLLIEWRITLRLQRNISEQAAFDRELRRFDDAIEAIALARDAERSKTTKLPKQHPHLTPQRNDTTETTRSTQA